MLRCEQFVGWALALMLVGTLANTSSPIEVMPPSPVPALSPTNISVVYSTEPNTFVFVIGVVDGKMFLPIVLEDAGEGKLTFSGPPGTYAIMGMEAGKRVQQTIEVVGHAEPGPGPGPKPDPPDPLPPGPRAVIIIYETGLATPAQRAAMRELQLYASLNQHTYYAKDKDVVGPNDQPVPWVVAYRAAAAKEGIREPFMVVGARDGTGDETKTLTLVPMPATGQEAIKILQKHGG